jgi:hypothetical protein
VAEIFRDGFNGTAGEDLTVYNPAWVKQPGITASMLIAPDGQSATATSSTNTSSYYRSDVIPPNADYSVSVDVTLLLTLTNAAAVGVTIRASSANITHYQFRFSASTNPPAGAWQLRRIVNNTATSLASTGGTFDTGETRNLRIETSGSQVAAYLDGSTTPFLGPVTSTLNDTGYPGVLATNAPASRAKYDNFVVDNGLAAGQQGNASITGVSSNPAAGSASASGSASATLSGVRSNPAAGSVTASGSASAFIIGVAASPAASSLAASGASSAHVVGVSAVPDVGMPLASGKASADVFGVAANPAAGTIGAGSAGAAVISGVAAKPSAADLVASGASNAIIVGVFANPAAGLVTAEIEAGEEDDIDALLVPPRQTVVFEGSIRVVAFEGSNRVVSFEGSKRLVEFQ